MPSIDDFRSALESQFREAETRNAPFIEINAGKLHREVGGYPGPNHQMPSCCQAMYGAQSADDESISRPPKGKGASLTIRYRLPRSATAISRAARVTTRPAHAVSLGLGPSPRPLRDHRRLTIASYEFEHICELAPLRNPNGGVREFTPQSRYLNAQDISLNKYGRGPFCQFRIPNHIDVSGVYALTINDEVRYVGECANFSTRFNAGYGNISPRNCFEKGQETNCRLNNLVYCAATTGEAVSLWFFKTADYKRVEADLRSALRPVWNRI